MKEHALDDRAAGIGARGSDGGVPVGGGAGSSTLSADERARVVVYLAAPWASVNTGLANWPQGQAETE